LWLPTGNLDRRPSGVHAYLDVVPIDLGFATPMLTVEHVPRSCARSGTTLTEPREWWRCDVGQLVAGNLEVARQPASSHQADDVS
jgi:hypothetical protein